MKRETISNYLKALLLTALLVPLFGCCGSSEETCGSGGTRSVDVALGKDGGEGAVSYQASGTIIEPTQCKPSRSLSGLEVPDANALQGKKILLIVHHKVPPGLTVQQILANSDYYISVDPGDSLTSEQLDLLFNGDLEFPIHHKLAAGIQTSTAVDLPQTIYVRLSWFDG